MDNVDEILAIVGQCVADLDRSETTVREHAHGMIASIDTAQEKRAKRAAHSAAYAGAHKRRDDGVYGTVAITLP